MSARTDTSAERAETERILSVFEAAGAVRVEAAILQPAGTLLDLYGEDIRARAYVTRDPVEGEMMLRPDFTVPVVQMHMTDGAEPARYAYAGPVFRRQAAGSARAREYLQVGFELFDRADPVAADAEVFALIAKALNGQGARAVTGDIGILIAAVSDLETTARRRAALMRHIWRPGRFRALLERFGGRSPVPAARAALVAQLAGAPAEDLVAAAGEEQGLRTTAEVCARARALEEDAAAAPIAGADVDRLEALLDIRGPLGSVAADLRAVAGASPRVGAALDAFEARVAAMAARGIAVDTVGFEMRYGRTSMEYYDGFVFGFHAGPEDAPVASGGRYDALTRVLGRGRAIPAVGGVIRPDLCVAARGGS